MVKGCFGSAIFGKMGFEDAYKRDMVKVSYGLGFTT